MGVISQRVALAFRVKTILVTVGGVVLLAGCGQLHPGQAAIVGETSISIAELDKHANALCGVLETSDFADKAVPMTYLRSATLSSLANNEIVRQIADEYDATPGPEFDEVLAQRRAEAQAVDPDLGDDYAAILTAGEYRLGVAQSVGRKLLQEEGIAEVSETAATQRGLDEISKWSANHETWFDGRFDVSLTEAEAVNQVGPVTYEHRTDLSIARTPDAGVQAALEQSNLDLPDSQRCGPGDG